MTELSTEFGPRKTVIILAVVAGCFAMLWPKILYPMLTASLNPSHSTHNSDCCDVIFESDVTAVDIMQELCQNIIRHHQVDPGIRDAIEVNKFNKLTPASISLCREEVLARCRIDLSSFLAEKERLKKSYKQVLEEIRGFNGSLCLKMQFGVPLARLGTPHLIRYHILMPHSTIKQERQTPPHAGSFHPALRERGRAIPSSHIVPKVQDRPDHISPIKMRPPMGGAGRVVAAPKGNGSLGLLMPLYTIGIIIFFLYTISKVLIGIIMPLYTVGNIVSFLYKILQVLRKTTDSEITRPEYSTSAAEREYQKLVFNPEVFAAAVSAVNGTPLEKNGMTHASINKPTSTIEELKEQAAGDIEIDQLRQRLVETEAAMERIVVQMSNLSRSVINCSTPSPEPKESTSTKKTLDQDEEKELEEFYETAPTVKVVNMEMTASCEGGQKCSRPTTPILITPHDCMEEKVKSPPISIYLEGALPPQCELLVTDSKTQEIQEEENIEVPVVLSGKMTLSLISLDQESQEIKVEKETTSGLLTSTEGNVKNERDKSDLGNVGNKEKTDIPKKQTIYKRGDLEANDIIKEALEAGYESDSEDDENFSIEEDINLKKIALEDYKTLISNYQYENAEKFLQNYNDQDDSIKSACDKCDEQLRSIFKKNNSYDTEFEMYQERVCEDKHKQQVEQEEDGNDEEEDYEEEEEEEESKVLDTKEKEKIVKVFEGHKEPEQEYEDEEYEDEEEEEEEDEEEEDVEEEEEDGAEEEEEDEDEDEEEGLCDGDNSENEENTKTNQQELIMVKNRI